MCKYKSLNDFDKLSKSFNHIVKICQNKFKLNALIFDFPKSLQTLCCSDTYIFQKIK